MNKSMEVMRNGLVENVSIEKLVESSSVMLSRDLNKKEFSIYNCICELVSSGKIALGYQFGIKRFNSIFVQWENNKSVEKSSVLPSVTDISNACKYFYKMNAKEVGFMPIIRINNDGSIIVDCVKYLENFYSNPSAKKEVKISREKLLEKIGKLVADLNNTINSGITDNILTSDDIPELVNNICDIDIMKVASKAIEKLSKVN